VAGESAIFDTTRWSLYLRYLVCLAFRLLRATGFFSFSFGNRAGLAGARSRVSDRSLRSFFDARARILEDRGAFFFLGGQRVRLRGP